MKFVKTLLLAAFLGVGMYTTGCETSHVESDRDTLFGGRVHKETTVTENPVTGDTNVTRKEVRTSP